MPTFVSWLFDESQYVPRAQCGGWSRGAILLHNASDAAIWLAYVMIPIVLVTFAGKRRDLPYRWVFVLFGAFIVGCGFTHFMEVVMFYRPMYNLAGVAKLLTAVVSMATVVALVPIIPRALALRSPEALSREIEERVRAEEQLRRFARELERSNRDLDDFATVASHDLQEPLRKIQSFGERLGTRYGPILGEDGRDSLGRMVGAAGRMARMIDALLKYSRVRSDPQPFVSVELSELASEVVGDLEGRIQQAAGRVSVGDLPAIKADPAQVGRLLQNLVANGLKFARPGVPPVISIRARRVAIEGRGPCVELAVEDNGIGIEAQYLDRVFELFRRLHGRHEYEGTGIGLAICRRIAERHGGFITATSTPGAGSTFLVTLPVEPPPPEGSHA